MCGIAGMVLKTGEAVRQDMLERMTNRIAHRGPDGAGIWVSHDGKVGLGHRRLSILDLSSAGAQPMHSPSQRYVISFNGEIYNFAELRKLLEPKGHAFNGHSDTEVILAACEEWGIEKTIPRLAGMFAIAIWDMQDQALHLVRDRVGIKPLYYSAQDGKLFFASELHALVVGLNKLPDVSIQGLAEFLRLAYVPGPLTILDGVNKLPPGTTVIFRHGKISSPQPYWSIIDVVKQGQENIISNESEALNLLDTTLRSAVASHMVSDVPLGAFLSGGIDSSTVVALMQAQSSRPVKTFSIGFREAGYNEAEHAAKVAQHLGTDHTELYVTDTDARKVIPNLSDIYDEPFADASQIPTFLVSELARQQVTVALSGDGGDELFAGYNRYTFVGSFWERLQKIPNALRKAGGAVLGGPSVGTWDKAFQMLGPFLPARFTPTLPGQKMQKVAAILPSNSLLALHGRLVSQWANPESVINSRFDYDRKMLWENSLQQMSDIPAVAQQMIWDTQTYLVDDILTKVDRASMRVSLEARVPLLDHSVIELAWRIPLSMKLRNGTGKWLLKQLLYKYVPAQLVERPKMGFSVPIDNWLRGPLRDWAETYLSERRINEEGYLDAKVIRQTWEEHLKGTIDRGGPLWTVLMFQVWLERSRQWLNG